MERKHEPNSNKRKRFIAFLLCMVMTMGALPMNVYATTVNTVDATITPVASGISTSTENGYTVNTTDFVEITEEVGIEEETEETEETEDEDADTLTGFGVPAVSQPVPALGTENALGASSTSEILGASQVIPVVGAAVPTASDATQMVEMQDTSSLPPTTPSFSIISFFSAKKFGINVGDSFNIKGDLSNVIYKSSKPQVVQIEADGTAIALKKGTAVITGTYIGANGKKLKQKCTVYAEEPKFPVTRTYINQYKSQTLKVKGTKMKAAWSTDNIHVASVNANGKVTGNSTGTCTITAVHNRKTYQCVVTVEVPHIKESKVYMCVGDTRMVQVIDTVQTPVWKSSKKKIVSVNEYGKITALKTGSAVVYTKINNKKYTTKVYVKKNLELHDHNWTLKENVKEADCLNDGLRYELCSICGEVKEITTPALGHTVSEDFIIDKPATCAEEGLKSHHCTSCGEHLDETVVPIDETNHNLNKFYTIDRVPTCTEVGEKSHHCIWCDKHMDIEDVPAWGHTTTTFYVTDKSATCTEDGEKSHHCTVCGEHVDIESIPALGHSLTDDYVVDKEATCTKDGEKSYHCKVCGEHVGVKAITATGHTVSGDCIVNKEATCTETGERSYCCSVCGEDVDTEVIPALGHTASGNYIIDKAPTCTEAGEKSHHCSVCSAHVDIEVIPATGHTASGNYIIDKEPTCTKTGERSHRCADCGERIDIETVDATGHTVSGDFIIDKAPTCTKAGEKSHHCSVCGEHVDVTVVDATGHSPSEDYIIDVAATCTETGLKSYHCTVCDEHLDETVVPVDSSNHVLNKFYTIDRAATCTEDGVKSHHCILCDAHLDIESIPATGHSLSKDYIIDTPATCTEDGLKSYHCSVCGAHVDETVIPKLDSSHILNKFYTIDKAATCTTDGEKSHHCILCDAHLDIESIPATGHSLSKDFIVDKAATCTTDGLRSHHCSVCKAHVDEEIIPATGHTASGNYIIDKEPTCTKTGERSHRCADCGERIDIETVDATGHATNEDYVIDKAPTCTKAGEKSHHCSVCGEHVDVTVVDATGHFPNGEYTIDEEPTCTEKGEKSQHCTVCDEHLNITPVDALGHTPTNEYFVDKEPTCTVAGEKSHHCTVCGEHVDIESVNALGHTPNAEIDYDREKGYGLLFCSACGEILERTANTYYVAYHGNGATGTISNSTFVYNVEGKLKSVTSLDGEEFFDNPGKVFTGWSTSSDSKHAIYGAEQKVVNMTYEHEGIVDLYAIWVDEAPCTYRVITRLYENDEETYKDLYDITLSGTSKQSVSPQPVTLAGYTTPSAQSLVLDGSNSQIIVYEYHKIKSDVTLEVSEGIKSVTGGGTYKYGDHVTVTAEVADGYSFKNWTGLYPGFDLIHTFIIGEKPVVLTAHATLCSYSLSYNLNGGTIETDSENPTTYTVKDTFTLNNPERDGYTFTGWTGGGYTTPTETVTITKGTTGNKTFKANWVNNQKVGMKLTDAETGLSFVCVDDNYKGGLLMLCEDVIPCNGTVSSNTYAECPLFSKESGRYSSSLLRSWMNGVFFDSLSDDVKANIAPLTISGAEDNVFALSYNDFTTYITYTSVPWEQGVGCWGWWTRTEYWDSESNVYSVYYIGSDGVSSPKDIGCRPAFVLDADAATLLLK